MTSTAAEGRCPTRPHLEQVEGGSDRDTPEETVDYVVDGNDLLWNALPKMEAKLAIRGALRPQVQVLVYGPYGHPGVARTLSLVKEKYR